MDLVRFGKILKNKRIELDLSLRDAADLVGVSHTYLSILEKAKDPRNNSPNVPKLETLKMISKAYNLNLELLLKLCGYEGISFTEKNETPTLPDSFATPEEAMQFILQQKVIMGFGGFDIDTLSDSEKVDFANELLQQLKLLSYKYKK